MSRLFRCVVVCLALVSPCLPFVHGQGASPGLLTTSGKWVRSANPDDVKLLGIVVRSQIVQAQRRNAIPPDAGPLILKTTQAYVQQDFNTAYRLVTRLIPKLQGREPGEGTEVAAAYDFRLDRSLVLPGARLTATLDPYFVPDQPLKGDYSATFSILAADGKPVETLPAMPLTEFKPVSGTFVKPLPPGSYRAAYELKSGTGEKLVTCEREFTVVGKDIADRLTKLEARRDKLAVMKVAGHGAATVAASESLEYIVGIIRRATKEYVAEMTKQVSPMTYELAAVVRQIPTGGAPFHLDRDLALAEGLAADLAGGRNPLAGRVGDLRLAHRSAIDGTLQPFRVFVPEGYSPTKSSPVIVALHGATGDENSYFDLYLDRATGKNLFKALGQTHGYILVAPNGRGAFGLYQNESEKDVIEVVERVKAVYAVDAKRIFLTGHSMGGWGSWTLGFKYPELFAALAPVAGRPVNVADIKMRAAPDKPVFYCQGAKDTVVLADDARLLADIARKELKRFTYKEFPDDDHFRIGISSMPEILTFFDAVGKDVVTLRSDRAKSESATTNRRR